MAASEASATPTPISAPVVDPETAGLSAAAGPCAGGPGAPDGAARHRLVTSAGIIESWIDGGVLRASGLRYATANRYAPPRPVRAAMPEEIVDATRFAPQPPQLYDYLNAPMLGEASRRLVEAEDCHFLSITMPADLAPNTRRSDQQLPVMVWIHGGSYETGGADADYFDTAPLVTEQRVITVSVGYRLGLLGYLGGDGRTANLGLLDQVEALSWVRAHIRDFGGDPRNITVFGESAGADSVLHLLAAHPDGALFDRAIAQSPPLGVTRNRAPMLQAMRRVARREQAGLPVWGSASAQDAPSAERVLRLQERIQKSVGGVPSRFGLRGAMCWGVEYGQRPVPAEEERVRAWARAAGGGIPLLVGSTAEEASFFTHEMLGVKDLRRLPRVGTRLYDGVVAAMTRTAFADDVDGIARLWAAAGGAVHRYQLEWAAPGNAIGSGHAIDIALMFATPERLEFAPLLRGADWEQVQDAGRALRADWASFARGEFEEPADRPGLIRYR